MKVSVQYWRLSVRKVAVLALLLAAQLVLGKFPVIGIWSVRIDFVFLATFLMGWWFGPGWAAIAAGLGDIVNALIFGAGAPYFPGFTVSAILGGLIYGAFFYRQPMTWWRAISASLLIMVVINVGLNTYWLTLLYHTPFWGMLPVRLLKDLVLTPIQIVLLYSLGHNTSLQRLQARLL